MISREEARNIQPEGYERGYYDGYHKGYDDKKSAVNKARKEAEEKYRKEFESIEIYSMYPLNMIYEIYDNKEDKCPLSLELISKALNTFTTERERRVLELRYRDRMSLEEVGRCIGVTRERVRQIQAKAQRKLRNPRAVRMIEVVPMSEHMDLALKYEELLTRYDELSKYLDEIKTPEQISAEIRVREKGIEYLDLSVRSYNCLKRAGYLTVGDLIGITYPELIKIRNLGRKGANEILSKLSTVTEDHEKN